MRVLYSFIIVCLVFTFGCAGMTLERGVRQDNTFYSSSHPKMEVKIHPDLEYIGKAEKMRHGKDVEGRDTHACERESHLFGYIEDGKIKKGVVVRIQTIVDMNVYWLPDIFGKVKNKLDSGTVKIQGKTYQYMVVASSRVGRKYERDFITNKGGYIMPNAFLVRALGKIAGTRDHILTHITYFEDISDKYSRRDWIDKHTLSAEQESLLEDFNVRSEENIQILGKEEVQKK